MKLHPAIRNQSKYIFLGRRLRGEEGRGRVREMQSRRTPRMSRNELVIAEQRITFDDVHNNALCLSTNNDYADPVYLSIRAIEARGYLDKSNCCRSFETNRFDSIGRSATDLGLNIHHSLATRHIDQCSNQCFDSALTRPIFGNIDAFNNFSIVDFE